MGFEIFLKGILVGLTASIPLGPIGVLCIQRTLSKSSKSGFVSGLGAASADTLFAILAIFSLSVVMSFVESHLEILKVLGGICIIILGVSIYLKNPVAQIRKNRAGKGNLWSDYITIFFLTLTNPAFILMFVGLFATFGVSNESDHGVLIGGTLAVGVLTGASLWWLILAAVVSLFRNKFRPRHLLWINRIAGAAIAILGTIVIISTFFKVSVDKILPS